MEIKIPKTISGGGIHSYRIGYKTNLKVDEGATGFLNHRKQVIAIDPAFPELERGVTFWHEALHKVSGEYSCNLDEDDTDRLAEGIVAILVKDFGIKFDWSDIEELE